MPVKWEGKINIGVITSPANDYIGPGGLNDTPAIQIYSYYPVVL
jgi:hypothetical protein